MQNLTNIRLLYAFNFLKSLQFFGSVAVAFYTVRLGFSYTQMFALEALFSVLLFLFEVPTGVVADKFGRKVSLFFGTLIFGLSFVGYGFVRSYPLLMAIQIPCAAAFSLMSGADRALVYEVAKAANPDPSSITARAARFDAFGSAGMFAAFPIGSLFAASGFLPYTSALAMTFTASGIALIVSGLLVLRVRENPRPAVHENPLALGIRGFTTLFRSVKMARLSINTALISGLTFLMFWLYQSILLELRFPVGGFGFVAAIFNGLGAVALFALGGIRKRVPVQTLLTVTAVVPGLLYLAAGLFPVLPLALLAIFGVTLMRFTRAPITGTLINDSIDTDIRATVLSGLSMLERLVITALYFAVGYLSDVSVPLTFTVLGILTLLIAAAVPAERGSKKSIGR